MLGVHPRLSQLLVTHLKELKAESLLYASGEVVMEEQEHADGGRQSFTGSPEQRAEDIRSFAEAGVSTMIVNVAANDKNAMLTRMAEFAENVMPLVD